MSIAMARRAPRREFGRQMARPLREAGRPVASTRPRGRYRRWIGPAGLVVLSFFGLVPLAGLGNPTPPTGAGGVAAVPSPTAFPRPTMPRSPSVQALALPARPWLNLPRPAIAPPPETPAPTATPSSTGEPRVPTKAPATAADFNRQRQVIGIGFPLAAGVPYHYRDNYGDLRPGPVEAYNHVFGERDGMLRRAHDGIDIYAPRGTAVLAPFDGVVINPSKRWQPWQQDRYGITVAIVSTEPATRGYIVLLCHLDERIVRAGAHVRRGREVGTLGTTGNAEESPAQLHFELRAPFLISWSEPGGRRLLDAFNPYPSLRASDPARTN